MKILLPAFVGGAFGHITNSWMSALQHAGFTVARYSNSLRDWDAFDPDLYIGCSGHRQNIPVARRSMVAIHVNPYGREPVPGIDESTEAIEWVRRQSPDIVFGYGFEIHRKYWSNWEEKLNIPWVPMPTAADYCQYSDLKGNRPFDVVYLGGKWAYKSKTMDMYLMPLLQSAGLKYRVAGWGDWPPEMSVKELALGEENAFFNTGKIGPCMSEPHTHTYGIDMPERAFKLALAGVLYIHDAKAAISQVLEASVAASDPDEYIRLHRHFINMPDKRDSLAQSQKLEILSSHTYHHRLANLLYNCGYTAESQRLVGLVS